MVCGVVSVVGINFMFLGLILLFLIMFLIFYLVKINKFFFYLEADVAFFIIF